MCYETIYVRERRYVSVSAQEEEEVVVVEEVKEGRGVGRGRRSENEQLGLRTLVRIPESICFQAF